MVPSNVHAEAVISSGRMNGDGDKPSRPIRFGAFELNVDTGELRKRGVKLRLPEQAYRVLRALLEQPGEMVSRERLKQRLWPDRTFVDFDSAINKCVSQLRTILEDTGSDSRFIETLPRRGYRFVAPVRVGWAESTIPGVIVLPFEQLSGDSSGYVAEGISDLLTTALGESGGLRVISRTTARACAAASKGLVTIGRELGVGAAIEGSVIRLQPRVCVTVRVVSTETERLLWQRKYEAGEGALFSLCQAMVRDIGTHLKGRNEHGKESRRFQASILPEAYRSYLKGRYLWNRRTERDLYASIEEFQRALSIQPEFALAHTGLADVYILLGIWGLQPSHVAFRMARRYAEQAIELNDALAEAHACLAEVLKDYDWDWPAAEREYQLAIELNPNYATVHHFYAQLLISLGRYDDAVAEMELARSLDPLSPAINAYMPYVYLASRDYSRAVEYGEYAIKLEPHSPAAHWQFGRACLFSGAVPRGLELLATAVELGGRMPMWLAELSFARARAGDHDGAGEVLTELLVRARSSYVSPYDLAVCYVGLGNNEQALRYLGYAYRERVMRIISLGDPEFDTIRQEPRFVSLVDQLLPAARFSGSQGAIVDPGR